VHVCDHEEDAEWDVVCARTMVSIYEEIVRIQQELTTLAEPYRGYSDGWGTFGNKRSGAQATG
jgi:hypothetical protein